MGKFKETKPTRAERKAQKRAAKAAAKQAEIDLREKAKEEKRAARAERSLFGLFKKKNKEESKSERAPGITEIDNGKNQKENLGSLPKGFSVNDVLPRLENEWSLTKARLASESTEK